MPRAFRWVGFVWLLILPILAQAAADDGLGWTPAAWQDIDVLEIRTVGPEEGEHWSKLWLVVIDDQLYVRLGSRAANRVQTNTLDTTVAVRIDGKEFDEITAEHVPDFRDRVAKAMSKKYCTDFLIRLFPHPMTVRLAPPANH